MLYENYSTLEEVMTWTTLATQTHKQKLSSHFVNFVELSGSGIKKPLITKHYTSKQDTVRIKFMIFLFNICPLGTLIVILHKTSELTIENMTFVLTYIKIHPCL
jgi:hypothetical protein